MIIYDLAISLGMPVYKLMNEMPYDELHEWIEYFSKRPYQWRDDLRAYQVMRVFGDKRKPQQVFPSLLPIFTEVGKEKNTQEMLKGSSMLGFLKMARGGEQLDVLREI